MTNKEKLKEELIKIGFFPADEHYIDITASPYGVNFNHHADNPYTLTKWEELSETQWKGLKTRLDKYLSLTEENRMELIEKLIAIKWVTNTSETNKLEIRYDSIGVTEYPISDDNSKGKRYLWDTISDEDLKYYWSISKHLYENTIEYKINKLIEIKKKMTFDNAGKFVSYTFNEHGVISFDGVRSGYSWDNMLDDEIEMVYNEVFKKVS